MKPAHIKSAEFESNKGHCLPNKLHAGQYKSPPYGRWQINDTLQVTAIASQQEEPNKIDYYLHKVPSKVCCYVQFLGDSEMHLEHVGADVHEHASIGARVTCVVLHILDSLFAENCAVARPVIFNASSCSTDHGCISGSRQAIEL